MGNYSIKKQSYKGATGSWTKWGGRRLHLLQDEIRDTWACQSCGALQPKELPPHRFKFLEKEYLRVCANCFANDCIDLFMRIAAIS